MTTPILAARTDILIVGQPGVADCKERVWPGAEGPLSADMA
jgi:hypothetical protein